MSKLSDLKRDLKRKSSPSKAKASAWYFKTGKGQYGEHDQFLGVTVPEQRAIAKQFLDLSLRHILRLLKSKVHEHRLTAVIILSGQFERGDRAQRQQIATSYLKMTKYVNYWDIVDSSAPHILGKHLLDRPRTVLYRLARSQNLWERRIAIIATQTFIRHGQYSDTLRIGKILLNDSHDLIHTAVGWMLREVGDRDKAAEVRFLKEHIKRMPRTMLRYAIEKFPERQRRRWLQVV